MKNCYKCDYKFNSYERFLMLSNKKIITCPKCNVQYEKVDNKSSKKSAGLSTIINILIMNILLIYIKSYVILGLLSAINVFILYILFELIFSKDDKYRLI